MEGDDGADLLAHEAWARITSGPIGASNGQLYVVNKVLLPGSFR